MLDKNPYKRPHDKEIIDVKLKYIQFELFMHLKCFVNR
jgi:hypothetical protein